MARLLVASTVLGLLLAAVSVHAAPQAQRASGVLDGNTLLMQGDHELSTTRASGVLSGSHEAAFEATVAAVTKDLLIKWRGAHDYHLVANPASPGNSALADADRQPFEGNSTFSNASIKVTFWDPQAAMAVAVEESGRLQFSGSGPLELGPAGLAPLRVGMYSDPSFELNDENSWATWKSPSDGHPLLAAGSQPHRVHGQGNVLLVLWGADLQVTDATGRTTTYRSGSERQDRPWLGLVPSDVGWTQRNTLLILEFSTPGLTIEQASGRLQVVSGPLDVALNGVSRIESASGTMRLGDEVYAPVRGSIVTIEGAVQHTVSKEPSSARLSTIFDSDAASVSSSAPLVMKGLASPVTPPDTGSTPTSFWTLGLALAIALVMLVGWLGVRRAISRVPLADRVKAAKVLLATGRLVRASQLIGSILRDQAADEEGLLLRAAHQQKRGRHEAVVRPFESGRNPGTPSPRMALILARSHAALGQAEAAMRFLVVAVQEPGLHAAAAQEDALAPILDRITKRRLNTRDDVGAAYA